MQRVASQIKSKFTFTIGDYMYLTQVEKTFKRIDLKNKAYKTNQPIKYS